MAATTSFLSRISKIPSSFVKSFAAQGSQVAFLDIKEKESNNLINNSVEINNKFYKVPKMLLDNNLNNDHFKDVKEALNFNKNLILENFILPNKLKFPLFRNILENYYS